jgi:hypothetical protein
VVAGIHHLYALRELLEVALFRRMHPSAPCVTANS